MRQLLTGLVVATATAVVPVLAFADNQEVATQIAKKLQASGQLSDYKIGVKYQNGTAWLNGRVGNREQMNTALRQVFQTPGVTRVVNQLTTLEAEPAQLEQPSAKVQLASVRNEPSAALPMNQPSNMPATAIRPVEKVAVDLPASSPAKPTPAKRASAPKKTTLAKRLSSVLAGVMDTKDKTAARPRAAVLQGQAQKVPSSFRRAAVRPTVAMVAQANSPVQRRRMPQRPIPVAYMQAGAAGQPGAPIPAYVQGTGGGVAPARYDQPHMPNHAWPSYAAYPNYAGLTYPRQYSPTAWPFIGPFYPYPQVPLGWRKVTLKWDDGWWMLDFKDH